ncbi:PepSY domain-containing protein [Hydrogenophaga crassostreae]|uniref:PepSY domain-containing protein n=1 Tax=Hydrogenophaga crassostreae TaxID=1763535 RepID=UPI0012FBC115|nr:PepSY domain-containing protein [Hydrogenophaga crassostreae]
MTRQPLQQPRYPFTHRIRTLAAASMALIGIGSGHALASEPKDRVICTDAPQSTWMSEAQARKRFQADTYLLVTFKLSSERCHEFYAVEHGGSAIEAYVHPVTGEVVRLTRIPLPGKATLPEKTMDAQPKAAAPLRTP